MRMRWLTLLLLGMSTAALAQGFTPPPGPIDLLVRVDARVATHPVLHAPMHLFPVKQILFRFDPATPSLTEVASFDGIPGIRQFLPTSSPMNIAEYIYALSDHQGFFALKNSPFNSPNSPSEYVSLPALPSKVVGIFPWLPNMILIATADQSLLIAQPDNPHYKSFAAAGWLSQMTRLDPKEEEILKIERLSADSFALLSTKGLRLVTWAKWPRLHLEARIDWVQLKSYVRGDTLVDFMADGEQGAWILTRDPSDDYVYYTDYDNPQNAQIEGASRRQSAAFLDVNGSGELLCSLGGSFHKLCRAPLSGGSAHPHAFIFEEANLHALSPRYLLAPGFSLSSQSIYAPRTWCDRSPSPYLLHSPAPPTGRPVLAPSSSRRSSAATTPQSPTTAQGNVAPADSTSKKTFEEAFNERVEALRSVGKLKDQPVKLEDWTPKNLCEALDDLPDRKLFLVNRTVEELKESLGLYKGFQQRFSPASEPYSRKKFPWKALWQLLKQNGCELTLDPKIKSPS